MIRLTKRATVKRYILGEYKKKSFNKVSSVAKEALDNYEFYLVRKMRKVSELEGGKETLNLINRSAVRKFLIARCKIKKIKKTYLDNLNFHLVRKIRHDINCCSPSKRTFNP